MTVARAPHGPRLAAIAYALFVAYLSLIPLQLKPLPLAEAWVRFQAIPFIPIDAFDRADWIANVVLFVPLGFLAAAAFRPKPVSRLDFLAILPAFAVGAVWAVAIEFVQLYFPNRTVSINDIVAEWIGAAAGALIWSVAGARIIAWGREVAGGGRVAANALLAAYAVGYLLLSLFPYDFLLSWQELEWKLASDGYGLWFAPGTCDGLLCVGRIAAEAVATAPLGWWFARNSMGISGRTGIRALLAGLVLGAAIEAAQFFIVSGIAQGASVASRAAGFMLGAIAFEHRKLLAACDPRRYARGLLVLGALCYLAVVGYVNGWFTRAWLAPARGFERLAEVNFLPFYYHYYYTSEAVALKSLLVHGALYVPVGVGWWLWRGGRNVGTGVLASVVAAAIAAVAEAGKLFIDGRHPDPTDVLVAAFAAWAAVRLMELVSAERRLHEVPSPLLRIPGNESGDDVGTSAQAGEESVSLRVAGAAMLLLAVRSVWRFPLGEAVLAVALAAYALALVRWPQAWLVVVPALLPVLDLAPWSGRFYWDELDIVLATTVGVLLASGRLRGFRWTLSPASTAAIGFFLIATIIALLVGLWPLAAVDANAFASYLSPYNALRQAKPVLWSLAFLGLMLASAEEPRRLTDRLFLGLALGNVATSATVLWERAASVGVLDFASDFRVSGLMSAMHTGGATLDGFLVLSLPFVLLQGFRSRQLVSRSAWALAFALGLYAVFVTFSRGALLGLAVAALIGGLAAGTRGVAEAGHAIGPRARAGWIMAGVMAAAMLVVATVAGPYMRERAVASTADLRARLDHWHEALRVAGRGPLELLTGIGIGRFPERYFWRSTRAAQLPGYSVVPADPPGGSVLRLGGGAGLFVEQRVPADSGAVYAVSFRARTTGGPARLEVMLCEKSIVQSLSCDGRGVTLSDGWERHTVTLSTARFRRGMLFPQVVLSLQNTVVGRGVEVDEVSLKGPDGRELIRNGGLDSGMDHWFFASDDHLAWHVKNLYLHVLIEQGWIGLLAFLLLVANACRLNARARSADIAAVAVLAAITGFLAVALFDTLIDAPRLLLAFLLVLVASIVRFDARTRRVRADPGVVRSRPTAGKVGGI